MLIRFRVANFRSLRDEQELSLVASLREDRQDRLEVVPAEEIDADLLRTAAVYGANAAGKSNVLAALRFMRSAVEGSHRYWRPEGPVPLEPFLLDDEHRSGESLFEVDLLLDGVRYQYGFRLDTEKVLEEWLYTYPKKRRQLWFLRRPGEAEPFHFGKHLKGNHRIVQGLTRENSLFLSVAAQNNHPALLPVYSWFAHRLRFSSADERTEDMFQTLYLLDSAPGKAAVLDLLRLADLGIVDLEIKDRPTSFYISDSAVPRVIEVKHQSRDGLTPLPIQCESRGTRTWISLAGKILSALEQGAVLFLDELDASLHPRLALEVVRLFQSPERNPRGAQLIFNTHDTTLLGNLLGEPALQRDQVWFVEKDPEGATHLYPLTDFKPRKFENLERGYLQGRYGAVPFIESQHVARNG